MDEIEAVRAKLRDMSQAERRELAPRCSISFDGLQKFLFRPSGNISAATFLRLRDELARREMKPSVVRGKR